MVSETYFCPRHKVYVVKRNPCVHCMADYERLPDASTMTNEARLAEFDWWMGEENSTLTIEFDMLHQRIRALVGRPVFLHELGSVGCVGLRDEIMGYEAHPDREEIVRRAKLMFPNAEIITFDMPEDSDD